ncbi:protein CHAPERONE-LIKE PROTEIN OF POR1, chloroplastic isoform X2 [Jatropha curcas]|uniref:protein CHAPERONE-LIKE PROTEIN OF POR1, chloroplastic isoform X2 n=1 Tax=Jatropha curcas TaxID=180498 RepID=UPI0005FACAEB|nr:protein CHAPERONE-LIKE PROTEIN OF POR1, chloroplastic isoform X2 [Jatropha curcas]
MTVSGLTGSPSRCSFRVPLNGPGSSCRRVSGFSFARESKVKINFPCLDRCSWVGSAKGYIGKQTHLVKCAMDASYGGEMTNDQPVIFPRIHVRDPYKRLGISRDANEDEIQGARNFLIKKYAGHKPSVDAIESAHDKIIMQKFYERKNPKIDIGKKVREVKQSRVVQAVTSRFQTPSTLVIAKTSIAFLVLGVLTVLFPTEEGPTLQVAISLMATIYFIYDRLKSKLRAFLYGYACGARFTTKKLLSFLVQLSCRMS